jgi:hypothetical protein
MQAFFAAMQQKGRPRVSFFANIQNISEAVVGLLASVDYRDNLHESRCREGEPRGHNTGPHNDSQLSREDIHSP